MNNIEYQLYLSGANIVFKKTKPDKPLPLNKWKVPKAPGVADIKSHSKQRIIKGIAMEPINKTAALVTSKRPKL